MSAHVSTITQAPALLPTMLDSSSNPPESVSSFSESAHAPNAPHLAESSILHAHEPRNHKVSAENGLSAPPQKVVTYHKVKKDPEVAAAREQQKERLVQLIDQVIALSESCTKGCEFACKE